MIITTLSVVVIHELHGGGTCREEIPRGPGGSWKACRSRDNCVAAERVGGKTGHMGDRNVLQQRRARALQDFSKLPWALVLGTVYIVDDNVMNAVAFPVQGDAAVVGKKIRD